MGGVANTTKKAFNDTVGQTKTLFTHPSKLNISQMANLSTIGGLSPIEQAANRLSGGGGKQPGQAGYTDNPAQTLAQTGGVPLLANIAMGADVDTTLAGYFGKSDFQSFYDGLDADSQQLVSGVRNQLKEIQSNTNLRNQAVQQVVNDFPNIAAQAATAQKQAKQSAGEEFDSTTKGYIDQALNGVAAKYAAGGGLSSGAMDAASARAGAQIGMDKLNYVTGEGDKAYARSSDSGLGAWQARYNETNALRNFQNLMTQGAAGQGFSAIQSSLGRTQQTNMANAGYNNTTNMNDQNNQNAMFGSIGQLGGTVVGAYFGGPAGAAAGGAAGKVAGNAVSNASSNSNNSKSAGSPDFSNWG